MHPERPGGAGNPSKGLTPKTLATEHGPVEGRTPRDRAGGFEPRIARKRQRHFEGFDEEILALYSRGLSACDIEAEIYGGKDGRDLIRRVTDGDIRARKQRPLETSRSAVGLLGNR
jgi:transposase-like protein